MPDTTPPVITVLNPPEQYSSFAEGTLLMFTAAVTDETPVRVYIRSDLNPNWNEIGQSDTDIYATNISLFSLPDDGSWLSIEVRADDAALNQTIEEVFVRDQTIPIQQGAIRGQITSALTNAPIAGAHIVLKPFAYGSGLVDIPVTTDENGKYFTDDILRFTESSGVKTWVSYTVNIFHEEYPDYTSEDLLFDKQTFTITHNVALTKFPVVGESVYISEPATGLRSLEDIQVTADDTGSVLAVWEAHWAWPRGSGSMLTTNTSLNFGVTWQDVATNQDPFPNMNSTDAQIGRDKNGNIFIVWHDGYNIFFRRSADNGATWGEHKIITLYTNLAE